MPKQKPKPFTGTVKILETTYAPGLHTLATITAAAAVEFPRVVTVLVSPQTPFFK